MSRADRYRSDPDIHIVTGVCAHDCPDTCSWQVAVQKESGRAVDLWGHPHHPLTDGRLCGKVDRYLERTYHSSRLTTPLRRVGRKGEGRFEAISWADAMAEIGNRLGATIDQYGPEAVLPYSYAGTMGLLQGEGMASRLWNRMGASRLARTICSEAGFEGFVYTLGATEGVDTPDFAHAELILLWGTNTLTSNQHLWPFVQEARKRGARVVVIDPARTRTARAADDWIGINPGTDAALTLGMMHVIVSEDRCDAEYVARHTVGFDQLRERVAAWSPARAAAVTGIDAERIVDLARSYAAASPPAIRINYGMQRHYGGGMAMRTVACLPALTGAWRHRGGGIQLSTSGFFRHMQTSGLKRPDLLEGRQPRTLNMVRLGDALSLDPARWAAAHYAPRPVDRKPDLAEAGPPVKALVVYNCNPAAVAPDQAAVFEGLRRSDLFTVVLEHFQTDTADYADIVLPATTQMEHWDLLKPYGHLYLALNRPAIEPVGESLPNSEIFRRMARALGYTDACFEEDDETILRRLIEEQTHPRFDSITWEGLMSDGFARLNLPQPVLPFANGNFPTPSGKCEFYSERMERDGYDPLPTYTPPVVAAEASQKGRRTLSEGLIAISPPAHSFLNSSFANVERLLAREGRPEVQIHPLDARDLAVADGEYVRLENDLGAVTVTARVTEDIVPGTVLVPGIWWAKFSPDGRNVNQITPQDETDMGGGASFYDTRVRVLPIAEAQPEAAASLEPVAAD